MGKWNVNTKNNDEWLTPPEILRALGAFDLDPCAPVRRPWDTARRHFTRCDDGLSQQWAGRVWMNPPYGRVVGNWMGRLADHGDGIALVPARTDTRWFQTFVFQRADAVFFFAHRLKFHFVTGEMAGSSGAPSCLVAYGDRNVRTLADAGLEGSFMPLVFGEHGRMITRIRQCLVCS